MLVAGAEWIKTIIMHDVSHSWRRRKVSCLCCFWSQFIYRCRVIIIIMLVAGTEQLWNYYSRIIFGSCVCRLVSARVSLPSDVGSCVRLISACKFDVWIRFVRLEFDLDLIMRLVFGFNSDVWRLTAACTFAFGFGSCVWRVGSTRTYVWRLTSVWLRVWSSTSTSTFDSWVRDRY